jgi:ADP-heptose:LPS heptosyltransferase
MNPGLHGILSGAVSIARKAAGRRIRKRPRVWDPGAEDAPQFAPPGDYLVCTIAGIGDAVMALPLVHLLRSARPQSRIVLLAAPINAELLRYQPALDDVMVFPHPPSLRRLLVLARTIRKQRFVAAIGAIPSDLLSLSLLLKMSGIPQRIKQRLAAGQTEQGWEFWFTDLLDSGLAKHKIHANLDLLLPIGIRPRTLQLAEVQQMARLVIRQTDYQAICARFPRASASQLRIGFHAGCKPGWEFKRWAPDRFAEAADRLIDTMAAEVYWFGDASERVLMESITSRMRNPSRSVAGMLAIRDAAALIATCDLFVSNDSGPMHIAAALGVNTVVLFSGNPRADPARTGPVGARHVILRKQDLQEITVTDVVEAAQQLISTSEMRR